MEENEGKERTAEHERVEKNGKEQGRGTDRQRKRDSGETED